MSKGVTKKKNRKLRRQIRKTVGALLMVSAITVAALPVPDVSALPSQPTGTEGHKIQVLNYATDAMLTYDRLINDTGADLSSVQDFLHSNVPYVNPGAPIYTTGQGEYQFAFVKPSATEQNEVAVILGASKRQLEDNKLTIPPSVDAYKKYIANSTSSGYCAVNKSDNFLFYRSNTQKLDKDELPLFWVPALGDEVGEINMYQGIREIKNPDGTTRYVYTREEEVVVGRAAEAFAEPAAFPAEPQLLLASAAGAFEDPTEIPAAATAAPADPTETPVDPAVTLPDPTETPAEQAAPTVDPTETPADLATPDNGAGIFADPVTPADGAAPQADPTQTPADPAATPAPTTIKQMVEYEAIPRMVPTNIPCYYHTRAEWENLEDNQLYYWDGGTDPVDPYKIEKFHAADSAATQRIHDAEVHYIGRQYLVPNTTAGGTTVNGQSEWKIGGLVTAANKKDGIFAENGNIVTLEIGDNLLGIGDYAFYGCSGLNSVTFGNGLNTLGNGVFEDCVNMTRCNMETFSNLTAIGAKAFYNCRALDNVAIPVNVRAIGDYCFAGCDGLTNIDLCGGQGQDGGDQKLNVLLSVIGYNAFAGCSKLISVTFPDRYVDYEYNPGQASTDTSRGIPITYFSGCSSLQFIKVQNGQFTFKEPEHKDNLSCDIGKFLTDTVPEAFYFEGPSTSAIHETAKKHSAAFKYLNEDKFEKVVWCPETEYDDTTGNVKPNTGHECTFIVDSSNRLIDMEIPADCGIVEIPANIGAGHGIGTIGSSSFQGNCFLKKIIIPSTVTVIEDNAFKGCHNLKDVIFSQPINITGIGTGAFSTQNVDRHKSGCGGDTSMSREPELHFTGLISPDSLPFQYAMTPGNNINNGTQTRAYITFYSGWPTNLTVQYNPETDKNELINYPKLEDLANYEAWNKNGVTAGKITYPDLTEEYADAARKAAGGATDTQAQQDAVNSYKNLNLPLGIESIKEGIFSDVKMTTDTSGNPIPDLDADDHLQYNSKNDEVETITMHGVEEVDPYTFAGSEKLKGFYMPGGETINDYAFRECKKLENVSIGSTVSELGVRPFAGCTILTGVSFEESPYFTCDSAIIYGLKEGAKSSIVECLETRGNTSGYYVVGPDEVAGVTSINREAFMDCGGIGEIDLSSTAIETISDNSFRNMGSLNSIALPDTVASIESGSFQDNKSLKRVTIPGTQSYIAQDAFMTGDWVEKPSDREQDPGGTNQQQIYLECVRNTTADRYAKQYWYLTPEYDKVFLQFNVYFYNYPKYPDTSVTELITSVKVREGEDAPLPEENPKCENEAYVFTGWTANYKDIRMDNTIVYATYGSDVHTVTIMDACPIAEEDKTILDIQQVEDGKSAKLPEPPEHEGYTFAGWVPDGNNITRDTIIRAIYDNNSSDSNRHKVTFYDDDGKELYVQYVNDGEAPITPQAPTKTGYTFAGWVWMPPESATSVKQDTTAFAKYNPGSGSSGGNGSGNGSGSNGGSSDSKSSASPSASPTATPSNGSDVVKYTVSVSGGSGSGQYAAGAIVPINAYAMSTGQVFDKWTTSTAGVGFADAAATSTTFVMPAANVAITATYKTGSGTSTAPAAGGGTGGGSSSGSGSTANRNTGATVDVTKPGFSNTGLAGATVSGATDNFVVKVTEDQTATDAATAALQARFGDLSRIKYLPMDISLYDSTGRTKIADTSGISVNLTLPLPDDLVQYAGNNRMAAVSGGALEDLNTRFTTVDGVPCVNFTATHFSPYVIYVDTANLTEATIDATPKTGDPIHPKWFLALGMASISLILFFKRDKVAVKTRTA